MNQSIMNAIFIVLLAIAVIGTIYIAVTITNMVEEVRSFYPKEDKKIDLTKNNDKDKEKYEEWMM